MSVYLDNAATTEIDSEVLKTMIFCYEMGAKNASSPHKLGLAAAKAVEAARLIIAQKICAEAKEIIFTSGGTESNNCALKGIAFANSKQGRHIIISSIEHLSTMEAAGWLQSQGFEITHIPVNSQGCVDPEDIGKAIRKETILVSIVHANNEIGTIEPIEQIGEICRKKNVYFHVDACQSFTKTYINVKEQNVDLVTFSAHKIHGPIGIGALYLRKGTKIEPLLHGGGQEDGFRSGTCNTAGIAGFGKSVEIADLQDTERMQGLRDYFIERAENSIEGVVLNGCRKNRLCNNISLSFRSINGKTLVRRLNERNIYISSGSACSSARTTLSHVLLATGMTPDLAEGTVRISLSKFTTKDDLDFAIQNMVDVLHDMKRAL